MYHGRVKISEDKIWKFEVRVLASKGDMWRANAGCGEFLPHSRIMIPREFVLIPINLLKFVNMLSNFLFNQIVEEGVR